MNDDEGIEADSRLARSLGFTGKASISPRHLDAINRCFSPSQAETDYARQVLAAIEDAKRCGKGAVALRGKMIDAPIAARPDRRWPQRKKFLRREVRCNEGVQGRFLSA